MDTHPRGVARFLPASLVATAAALLLPALLAGMLWPRGRALSDAGSAVLAGALSVCLTCALSAVWRRRRASADVMFSDLMLWGLVRRWRVERRLHEVRTAYEVAARENEVVRVAQLEGLARLLARRDPYTNGHCQRVARHAERIARALHLSAGAVAKVRTAALIHDVGKVYTPREILNKPGALNDEEFAIVKRHAVDGAEMVAAVRDRELALIVRHHHERMEGGGYPDGLAGDEIPLGARIIAVADTFDAVTSRRPYRAPRSQRAGLDLLVRERGRQLDARAVDAFITGYSPRRSVAWLAAVAALFNRAADAWMPGVFGFGGGTLAPLAAALGAAGIAAAAPAAAARHATGGRRLAGSSALRSLRAGSSPGGTHAGTGVPSLSGRPHAPRPTLGRSHPRLRAGPPGHLPATVPTHVSPPGTVAATPRPGGGTGQLGGVAPVELPTVPVGAPPPINGPPVSTPPVTAPPVSTPPVTVPPVVHLPPVSTPPITLPPVSTPPVTIGSSTAPVVSVPPITVPKVTVPPLHVP